MKTVLIILLSCLAILTRAQEYSYKQFTTADGLPSNVVYGAFQDKDGYIWFCTNAGVSRFNGINFQNFTVEQGLSDNEVFGAFQTKSGRIWFRTFSNKLCYFENGSFHNPRTDPWLNNPFWGMKFVYVAPDGLVWTRNYLDSSVYVMDEQKQTIIRFGACSGDSSIIVTTDGVDTVTYAEERLVYDRLIDFMVKERPGIEKLTDAQSYFMAARRFAHSLHEECPAIPIHFIYHVFVNLQPIPRFKLHEVIYPAKSATARPEEKNSYWLTNANKGIAHGHDLLH